MSRQISRGIALSLFGLGLTLMAGDSLTITYYGGLLLGMGGALLWTA